MLKLAPRPHQPRWPVRKRPDAATRRSRQQEGQRHTTNVVPSKPGTLESHQPVDGPLPTVVNPLRLSGAARLQLKQVELFMKLPATKNGSERSRVKGPSSNGGPFCTLIRHFSVAGTAVRFKGGPHREMPLSWLIYAVCQNLMHLPTCYGLRGGIIHEPLVMRAEGHVFVRLPCAAP